MKKIFTIFVIVILFAITNTQAQLTVFYDDFLTMNPAFWKFPIWTSPTDGTFLGRTQLRCVPATLPTVSNSEVSINLDTYNPTGYSFYGTDLISNRTFLPGNGLIITIRARMNTPIVGGIVGGIFSFDTTTTGLHDEIDFELVTNQLNYVHTNVYSDEPLGAGHPDSSTVIDPITQYHTYTITWLQNEVTWAIDNIIVRTETTIIPDSPTHFHLNMWVPASEWPSAYNVALQPTNNQSSNQIYSMLVDYVQVDSLISTGITNEIVKAEPLFYPNPAYDKITFTAPVMNLNISTINGDMIENREIIYDNVSVNNLVPGMYIIRYEYANKQYVKKLIIY